MRKEGDVPVKDNIRFPVGKRGYSAASREWLKSFRTMWSCNSFILVFLKCLTSPSVQKGGNPNTPTVKVHSKDTFSQRLRILHGLKNISKSKIVAINYSLY